MKAVDRSAPLPLYYQLKQILLAEMKRRHLEPGDRFPGDHELCNTYGVSRTVVRQALSELEAAGVIERINGRGTFVAQPKTAEGLAQSLTGLYEDVTARGAELYSEVRQLEAVPADDQIAEALQIEVGAPVIALDRLRFVNGSPWALTMTHIPYELAPGLLEEDMTQQSLYALLEGKYGVQLKHGRRTIDATTADAALARDLRIRRGAPVLVLSSTSYGMNDRPVEVFVAYHRGDRSRFEVVLTRSPLPMSNPLVVVTD
jgi:GntR family transcriptional regulator